MQSYGTLSVLCFENEKPFEYWIVGKMKIRFIMHEDGVKADVYNAIKQTGRINAFVHKQGRNE